MKLAFSTIACPDWTLERVMGSACRAGYDGVELRTFGWGGTALACDPALTDAAKVRLLAIESGTHIMCLGTSVKFDDRVWPPVIGRALPGHARCVQAGRRFVDLADDLECPAIRVFGFESHRGERRGKTVKRLVERLREVLDAAAKRRVTVLIENGGSFAKAEYLAEVLDACDSPHLGACYNLAVGAEAGDRVEQAIDLLGDRLSSVKLKDLRDRAPVEIGQGEMPLRQGVQHLARAGYDGWTVVEWMRFWRPELAEPEGVLTRAMQTLRGWIAPVGAGPARHEQARHEQTEPVGA